MAAARQNEMNVSIAVVATSPLATGGGVSYACVNAGLFGSDAIRLPEKVSRCLNRVNPGKVVLTGRQRPLLLRFRTVQTGLLVIRRSPFVAEIYRTASEDPSTSL